MNIWSILLTLHTFHAEMLILNTRALKNMLDISFTFDTSHVEMLPLNELV